MTNSEIHLKMLREWASKNTSGEYCYDFDANCDECPSFISEHCKIKETEEAEAAEVKAPKGWVKLRTTKSYAYIKASKIVALWPAPAATTASGEFTSVYAIGRSSPWHVYGSIDEVMEKIKRCIDTED